MEYRHYNNYTGVQGTHFWEEADILGSESANWSQFINTVHFAIYKAKVTGTAKKCNRPEPIK